MRLSEWGNRLGSQGKSLQISTSATKEITNNLTSAPLQSQLQAVIVWLPERFHPTAANSLLKMVEEPPKKTFFFFISCSEEKILAPLRSRMSAIYLPLLSSEELAAYLLATQVLKDKKRAQIIASRVKGRIGEALQIVKEPLYYSNLLKMTVDWLRNSYARRWGGLLVNTEKFQQLARNEQVAWITYTLQLASYITQLKAKAKELYLLPEEYSFCIKIAKVLSYKQLQRLTTVLKKLLMLLQRNSYPKLAFFQTTQEVVEVFSTSPPR